MQVEGLADARAAIGLIEVGAADEVAFAAALDRALATSSAPRLAGSLLQVLASAPGGAGQVRAVLTDLAARIDEALGRDAAIALTVLIRLGLES